MGYIIWTIKDNAPHIIDLKFQLLSVPKTSHSGTYSEFVRLVGKKEAQAALKRHLLDKKHAFQQRVARWTGYPKAKSINQN